MKKLTCNYLRGLGCICGTITGLTPCGLLAATFTVTTTNISGPGSLPVVMNQAIAASGDNVVEFGVTNMLTLALPLPTITNNLTIIGRTDVPTVISGGGVLPIFTFSAGTTNVLSGLNLINGFSHNSQAWGGAAISNAGTLFVTGTAFSGHRAIGDGGAILNFGQITIVGCRFNDNQAGASDNGANGGAIAVRGGTMTLMDSVLWNNQARSSGGAIVNLATTRIDRTSMWGNQAPEGGAIANYGGAIGSYATLIVSRSALYTNSANGAASGGWGSGGALYSWAESGSATVMMTNCTFSGNVTSGGGGPPGMGGAVFVNSGGLSLVNCTLTANSTIGGPVTAGGVVNVLGNVTLLNTIVAANSATDGSPDLYGTYTSSGVNLIGNNQGATGLSINDFQNVSANLGPLQNNGGATLTCIPLQGSLAIGYGTSVGAPPTDQRGVPRPQKGGFDIGAVQVVTSSPIIISPVWEGSSGFAFTSIFDSTNTYRLMSSTDLATWVDMTNYVNGGSHDYSDPLAISFKQRFYRAVAP